MIDFKKPLRTAYFQLLDGFLSYNYINVPVSDDILSLANGSANVYVILSTQSGSDTSTFQSFDSREDIVIDIVSRAQTRIGKSIVDSVANQILLRVLPAPAVNGLPAQPNLVFQNVQKISDRYLDLQVGSGITIVRRLLTFTQTVRQTS